MAAVYEIDTPVDDDISSDPLYDMETLWKDTICEFTGTFTFIYISLSGVNQSVITNTGQLGVAMCFAFGLTAGIHVAGRSGGHLNPAVSLVAFLTNVDFDIRRFAMYVCAQMLGGVVASMLIMSMYYSVINNYKHKEVFAGTFGTEKSQSVSVVSSIIDQFIGSVVLINAVMLSPDNRFKPLSIGCSLGALGLFQGLNGFAFNLARDLGPRIVSSWAIGSIAFSANDYWFWIPAVVPFFAMPAGVFIANYLKTIN